MKKMLMYLIVSMALIGLMGGCALFQKPPANPDEKAAWIQNTQDALYRGNLGESAAFTIFSGLCIGQRIDVTICSLGYIADQEWKKNYDIAQGAVTKYGAGELTQAEAQKLVDMALLDSLKNVMAALMPAQKVIDAQATKARSIDLYKPSGEKSPTPVKK